MVAVQQRVGVGKLGMQQQQQHRHKLIVKQGGMVAVLFQLVCVMVAVVGVGVGVCR
jgi:hypothetical protein